MNKILSLVWNNYDNDDRVKKKTITLSKNNKVEVICVAKPHQYKQPYKEINPNLRVHYIKVRNMFYWLFYRLIANNFFWKDSLKKHQEYIGYNGLIIDSNDPDTLFAGYYIKKLNGSVKWIYDSHEYWKGTRRKETFLLYTIYTYIGNTIQYIRELIYAPKVDKIITVAPIIAEKLKIKYNKPVLVIPNYCEYRNITQPKKPYSSAFVGSYIRPGAEEIARELWCYGYTTTFVGNVPNKKYEYNYTGYMTKKEYLNILDTTELGICYFEVDHDNMKFSFPNKLSEYIQTNCIPIVNNEMLTCKAIIEKYKIGILVNPNKLNSGYLNAQIDLLKKDKDLKNRFELAKKELCWEAIEDKLRRYYI